MSDNEVTANGIELRGPWASIYGVLLSIRATLAGRAVGNSSRSRACLESQQHIKQSLDVAE